MKLKQCLDKKNKEYNKTSINNKFHIQLNILIIYFFWRNNQCHTINRHNTKILFKYVEYIFIKKNVNFIDVSPAINFLKIDFFI